MKTEGNAQTNQSAAAAESAGDAPLTAEAPPSPQEPGSEELMATESVTVKSSELEDLKADAAKAAEYWDKLVRTAADFENYKKRAARERQDAVKYANEGLLEKLIPVLDAFEMALTAASPANAAPADALQSFQTGINLIYQQLKRALTEAGLEEIDARNQPFDPKVHEAVSQQETAAVPEGQVLQQIRKGYKLRDRLVRPAGVVVAKAPGAN
jgi:molecular chaperone GrpE